MFRVGIQHMYQEVAVKKKTHPVDDLSALTGALYVFEAIHGIRDDAELSEMHQAVAYALIANSEHPDRIAAKIARVLIECVFSDMDKDTACPILVTIRELIDRFAVEDFAIRNTSLYALFDDACKAYGLKF